MALITPPNWLQAGTYTAQQDRVNQQGVFNTSGVIGSASLAVTAQASPNMTVNIASGWGAIVATTSNLGVYGIYNDATVIQSISAADATNPRIDLIVATVNDAQYSGSLNNVVFTTVAGTPAASPTVPSTPSNSIVLAQIAVAANASTITTANITDRRLPVQNALLNANYYLSPATYTLTTQTAVQNAYALTGSGLTLTANTFYEIEGFLRLQYTVGATAAYPTLSFGYTGATGAGQVTTMAWSNATAFTSSAVTDTQVSSNSVSSTWQLAVSTTASQTKYINAFFKGVFSTSTAGVLTPKISFNNVTTVSAIQSLVGSSLKITPVGLGSGTSVSVGAWS